jgi:hypothetical protein
VYIHTGLSPQGDESSPRGRWGIWAPALPEVLTEWAALAVKLHQRNYMSKNSGGPDCVDTRTCFKCNKVGLIAPNFPEKTENTSKVSGTKKTEPAGAAREAKVLA